jgi:GAF domain-containing protein
MSGVSEFAGLLVDLHDDVNTDQMVQHIVDTAVRVIHCNAAGVMLVHGDKRIESAAFSDESVKRADLLQLELHEGPCLSAMAGGDHFRIDNTTTDERWPRWCAGVAEFGIRSVISVWLANDDRKPVGSLLVYSHRTHAFDDEDVAIARILGAHAAIAVRRLRRDEAVERAIDSRTLIGQAEGVIMAKYRVSADQAFAALTRCSQASNRKLRDIASEVVHVRGLPVLKPADQVESPGTTTT